MTRDRELDGDWDVVIVGHGFAGLSAAKSYLEAAAAAGVAPRLALLEQSTEENKGGSTAWTTAYFRLDGEGRFNDSWAQNIRRNAGELANEPYIDAMYANVHEMLEWIKAHGVVVESKVSLEGGKGWNVQGGGKSLITAFTPMILDEGGRIFYETTAQRLVRDGDGRVSAIVVRSADGAEHTMRTNAVVLASGGFEGNREMLSRYIPNAFALKAISPGTQNNRGDGIRMATEIGADTAGQFDAGHLEPTDPRSDKPEPNVHTWQYGILVNTDGVRFMDETAEPFDVQFDTVANTVFRTQKDRLAYAITDAGARAGIPWFPYFNWTDLPAITADTIEELAEKIGVPADALVATVAEFNAGVSHEPFDPATFKERAATGITPPKSHYAIPVEQGPFEAWPLTAQICFTFGGLRVDGAAHVLDNAGAPIAGLYAAGEITGVFYQQYPSGSSGMRSLTFGRLAGRQSFAETADLAIASTPVHA